jgi:hypothetical protein
VLNPTDTRAGDDDPKELAPLPELAYLHLKRTQVTDESVKAPRKARPKCEIFR